MQGKSLIRRQSLKKLKFGLEVELFTLDGEGRMISGAPRLMRRVKRDHPRIQILKECGKSMVEVISRPDTSIPNTIQRTLEDYESILHSAEKEGMVLYSYGTYPGSFIPELSEGEGYNIKELIFGTQRMHIAARCIGLHCHFCLPWGVFDHANRILKSLVNSKNHQSMINLYNLFIAMDPGLTTFTQSSPFYQGRYLGKDSRVIVYRGGEIFGYPQGLYSNFQEFGGLQAYKHDDMDLAQIITNRFQSWDRVIKKIDVNLKAFLKRGSILDTAWNPVKISSHGTLEQRGMDINHPRVILAVAALIGHISKAVQEKYLNVKPSMAGRSSPFRLEGGTIHIPPHEYVRLRMQPQAAYEGLADNQVYAYCRNLLKLGKACMPRRERPLLMPLERMLEERRTVSDEIVSAAKKMGISTGERMTNSEAAELALRMSSDLFREIIMTKQLIRGIGD